MVMPFFKVLPRLWLGGLFISSQAKPAFQGGLCARVIASGDAGQGAGKRAGCTCVCKEGPGPGSCQPGVCAGFKQTQGKFYGNARRKSLLWGMRNITAQAARPPSFLASPSAHGLPMEVALGPPRSLSRSGVRNHV